MDHANLSTMRVHVERSIIEREKFSRGIVRPLGAEMTPR
jgi:hypothetical protein